MSTTQNSGEKHKIKPLNAWRSSRIWKQTW